MPIIPISTLKSKFESGDRPTGSDFADLIDTTAHNATALGADGNNSSTINGIENPTVIDTIITSTWRTVKYLIQISHAPSNSFVGTELHIIFDGTNVNISEYGTVSNSESDIATISASYSSGIISLTVTPTLSPVTVRYYRTGLRG